MKIKTKPTQLLEITINVERGDSDWFFKCRWARFLFDCDRYVLFTETDCGNYTYGWAPPPKTESFLKLMSRINEEYLLHKLCDQNVFQPGLSKKETCENLRYNLEEDLTPEFLDSICQEINEIETCGSEEIFENEVGDILCRYKITDAAEFIQVVHDYPLGAKTLARLFHTSVQPEIRKYMKKLERNP